MQSGISTYPIKGVAKVSMGHFPPPFLINNKELVSNIRNRPLKTIIDQDLTLKLLYELYRIHKTENNKRIYGIAIKNKIPVLSPLPTVKSSLALFII